MNDRIRDMLDQHEIREVLTEYCRGCDRLDLATMAGVYAKTSFDDHGDIKCAGPEFAERTLARLVAGTEMCSHHLGQSTIRVRGDIAGAETYFVASIRRRTAEGAEMLDQMGGRYVDLLQRDGEGWKIRRRVCVRDWSTSGEVRDWLKGFGFVEGARSPEDPAFAVLEDPPAALAAMS